MSKIIYLFERRKLILYVKLNTNFNIKLIRSDNKDIYNVTKDLRRMPTFLFNKESWINLTVSTKIWSSTTIFLIIRNVSWAANQHIKMISVRSCDTEDWSNDAENSALITGINYIWKHSKLKTKKLNNISQYYCFYWILIQINAALVSLRNFF